MNTLSSGLVDSLASVLGCPPAYSLTPSRPPPLNLRKDARSSQPSSTPAILRVTQFLPAYGIQLFLRVHSVPHVVVNTEYRRCMNNTSGYPLLTDTVGGINYMVPSTILGGGGGGSYAKEAILSSAEEEAASPSLSSTPLGEPLAHVMKHHVPDILEDPSGDNSVALYTNLVSSTLSPLLLALSFADNGEGYECTRSLYASPPPDLPEPLFTFVSLLTWVKDNLSLWAEKVSVVRSLSFPGQLSPSALPTRCRNGVSFFAASSSLHVDVPASLRQASNAYRILSDYISSRPPNPHFFQYPTTFDPLVFEHIYLAIVNPHLVNIVRSYPLLLSYFTNMVDKVRT